MSTLVLNAVRVRVAHAPRPAYDLAAVAARLLAPAARPAHGFRQIPPHAIACLLPRAAVRNPFDATPFPQFPADQRWSSSRQHWQRAAFRSHRSARSPWLVRRAAQHR